MKYLDQSKILYQSNDSIQDIIRAFFKSEPSLRCINSDASSSIHHNMFIVEGSADSIGNTRAGGSSNGAANIVVHSWWIQGFIGLAADSVGLLLSYPFLIHSVRQQAAAAPATLPASLNTSHSFDDPISNYCNTCSYYYNGFLLVFIARSMTSWLFCAVLYQYLLNNIGPTIMVFKLSSAVTNGFRAFSSSWVAGCLVAVVTNPIWVTVTRLQVYGEMPQTFEGML